MALLFVQGDLSRGRDHLQDARSALIAGDLDTAAERFDAAARAFGDAEATAAGRLGRLAGWVPLVGNNVDVAAGLARAGMHVAGAGSLLTGALAELPKGLGSLAPRGGRIPVGMLARLSTTAADARAEIHAAFTDMESTPSSFLVGPVEQARWDAEEQIGDADRALLAAELVLRGMPSFAGADGQRRYLLVAENPAELRGTGGIWGAYALLSFVRGELDVGAVRPIQSLPSVSADDLPAPNPDYRRNYDQFGGAGSWLNMNMTPDFPSAAKAALAAYRAGTGDMLDGVIAADPFALQAMMEVTGDIEVPGLGRSLPAEDVVAFTTNEAYARFKEPARRKEVLGAVAADVLRQFVNMDEHGIARLRIIAETAAEGHLKVYTGQADVERGLETAGAAGGLETPLGSDVLAVTVNNAGGNKIDYYAARSVSYSVQLGGDGEAIASADVTIANEAPISGQPSYVIGPNLNLEEAKAGDQLSLVSVTCHAPCQAHSQSVNGVPVAVDVGSELGQPWYRFYRTIPAGATADLALTTTTSGVWEGDSSGGTYRLTVLGQTTIRPTQLRVSVSAPDGTNVVWTNEPMEIDGGTATWQGVAPSRLDLVVSFSAPAPLRWWRNVGRAFGAG